MKLAVFGASGAIGNLLVKKALEDGYEVKAYVRNPKKLNISHAKLSVTKGELDDLNNIMEFLSDTDAVLSTLGSSIAKNAKGFPILEGHINILKAMELKKKARFITIGTPSIRFDRDKKSSITQITPIFGRRMVPNAYKEIVSIGHVIDSSKLDWTVVRFVMPVDEETGQTKVTFGDKKIKWKISRKRIAHFVLDQVKSDKYIQSMPIIGS